MNAYKNETFEAIKYLGAEPFDRQDHLSGDTFRLTKEPDFPDTFLNPMNTPEFQTPPPRKRRSNQYPSNVGNALCANAFVPATVHNRFFSVLS